METIVHERVIRLVGDDGNVYALVRVHAEQRADGRWEGWIEFTTETGQRVVTERETTQSSKEAVAQWASGLGSTFLEGALQRAVGALQLV